MSTSLSSLMKRLSTALAVIALAATATLAGPAGAQEFEDEDMKDFIQIKTKKTAAVVKGDTAWVAVSVRGKQNLDDVRFTATLSDGTVAYPTNTVDHSGPYDGYDLDKKETDYVAFQLTVPPTVTANELNLDLVATFQAGGDWIIAEQRVKVPVVTFAGDPYTLVSNTAAYPTVGDDAGWVGVSFAGLAPRVESFRVAVSNPAVLDVYYPLESFTSLANDDLLEDGETDVTRFRLAEAHWGAPMDVELQVDYVLAGVATTDFHTVTVNPG